ncbi:BON domain-containing protein [Actinoplanes sp. NPDC026619]|uniref:BON domain-containing protein n=1 Tax=Actinoplanes sp. NPDC026619 TaxID=3155798 RepID=UPI0033C09122
MQPLPDDEFLAQHRRHDPVVTSADVNTALVVVLELNAHDRTSCEAIRVSVQNNVVVLEGSVQSWAAHDTAADIVRAVAGDFDVCNALRVRAEDGASAARDEFDAIVEGPASRAAATRRKVPFPAVFSPRTWPLLLPCLALPWFLLLTGWSGLPMVVAVLAVTAGVIFTHRR